MILKAAACKRRRNEAKAESTRRSFEGKLRETCRVCEAEQRWKKKTSKSSLREFAVVATDVVESAAAVVVFVVV